MRNYSYGGHGGEGETNMDLSKEWMEKEEGQLASRKFLILNTIAPSSVSLYPLSREGPGRLPQEQSQHPNGSFVDNGIKLFSIFFWNLYIVTSVNPVILAEIDRAGTLGNGLKRGVLQIRWIAAAQTFLTGWILDREMLLLPDSQSVVCSRHGLGAFGLSAMRSDPRASIGMRVFFRFQRRARAWLTALPPEGVRHERTEVVGIQKTTQ